MAGAKHSEMAPIQRRELRFVQTLDNRENCRVHEANIGVGVSVAQVADVKIVVGRQVFNQ